MTDASEHRIPEVTCKFVEGIRLHVQETDGSYTPVILDPRGDPDRCDLALQIMAQEREQLRAQGAIVREMRDPGGSPIAVYLRPDDPNKGSWV